ncbi:exocyst complex component exo84 [Dimargaris xerosporica]|nr:exocyst complex component exo84 [Dimargaris xerosporica]
MFKKASVKYKSTRSAQPAKKRTQPKGQPSEARVPKILGTKTITALATGQDVTKFLRKGGKLHAGQPLTTTTPVSRRRSRMARPPGSAANATIPRVAGKSAGPVQVVRRLDSREGSAMGSPGRSRESIMALDDYDDSSSYVQASLTEAGITWSHRYLQEFADENFNPRAFLAKYLRSINEKDIKAVMASLLKSRQAADQALQRNVYKTYPEFIEISKEMVRLETDMFLLKDLLAEIKVIGQDLTDEMAGTTANSTSGMEADQQDPSLASASAAAKLQRRRTLRSSVADHQALFHAQMTRLWNTVEDAQKFVPFHPHRHVVTEYHGLRELNPTTFQYKQSVSLILLNDSLLVAARKKRSKTTKAVLVADKCFLLTDITIVDLQDSAELPNAIKLIRQAETYLLYCGSADTKKDILSMVKKAVGTFIDASSGSTERKNTGTDLTSRTVFVQEDDAGQIARLEALHNSLDVHIAHREFEKAVQLVEQSQTLIRQTTNTLTSVQRLMSDLRGLQSDLAAWIVSDLSLPNAPKAHIVQGVRWLIRLGRTIEAKDVFLAARSATIRHRTRQLKLEGNTHVHIRELAMVFFYLIRNTCSWYMECFDEKAMTSGLIKWVREELSVYAEIFRRQVFHSLQQLPVIAECLRSAEKEMSILIYSGLDLNFMLDQEFQRDLNECIKRYEEKCATSIAKSIRGDDFAIIHHLTPDAMPSEGFYDSPLCDPDMWMSSSVAEFEHLVVGFLNEIQCIARETLYGQIVASTSSLVESALKLLLTICRNSSTTDDQCFVIIINCRVLIGVLLPKIAARFSNMFHRPAVDFDNLQSRLESFPRTVQEVFCQKKSTAIAQAHYPFATMNFLSSDPITDTARPTSQMIDTVLALTSLGAQLDLWPLDKRAILAAMIERFFYGMTDPAGWDTSTGKRVFGSQGVQQLVLDIHFFLRVAGPWVTKSANTVANKLCEKALRIYFSTNKDRSQSMKTKPWYDARVAATIDSLGPGFPNFGQSVSSARKQSAH